MFILSLVWRQNSDSSVSRSLMSNIHLSRYQLCAFVFTFKSSVSCLLLCIYFEQKAGLHRKLRASENCRMGAQIVLFQLRHLLCRLGPGTFNAPVAPCTGGNFPYGMRDWSPPSAATVRVPAFFGLASTSRSFLPSHFVFSFEIFSKLLNYLCAF